jgi:hypothetical protein
MVACDGDCSERPEHAFQEMAMTRRDQTSDSSPSHYRFWNRIRFTEVESMK